MIVLYSVLHIHSVLSQFHGILPGFLVRRSEKKLIKTVPNQDIRMLVGCFHMVAEFSAKTQTSQHLFNKTLFYKF